MRTNRAALRSIIRVLEWLAVASVAVLVAAWWLSRPAVPDPFYTPEDVLPGKPGMLLRQQAFERGVPASAQAWRILYTTTRSDGSLTPASAIVMAARKAAPESRPVVAWTHGTTGVVRGCAPSLLDEPFANVPALASLLDRGWVFVATDYVGLGTPGPHPYLIGESEARSALDAVRAARQLDTLKLDGRTVVWGYSQGGHAALWTGIVAPTYAPDVPLAGVAAAAPATDLRPLLEEVQHTPIGRIMSSYLLRAYTSTYTDIAVDAYVPLWKRPTMHAMASRCLAGRQALVAATTALFTGGSIFSASPSGGSLGERLAQNTPLGPWPQPVLIAQGLADDLVVASVQTRFVRARCAQGSVIEFRTYGGRDHVSIVAADSPLTRELLRWTEDRLAGVAAPTSCNEVTLQ